MRQVPASRPGHGETGAALVLAMVFLVVIALVLVAVGNLATTNLEDSSGLGQERAYEVAASSATTASIQWVRNVCTPGSTANCFDTYSIYSVQAQTNPIDCLPNAAPSISFSSGYVRTPVSIVVDCSGIALAGKRAVTLYACALGASCGPSSSSVILVANVTFFDANPDGSTACSGASVSSCGISMAITQWDTRTADH